jgi:hypothetical protein
VRQIDLICAPHQMSANRPLAVQIGGSARVSQEQD